MWYTGKIPIKQNIFKIRIFLKKVEVLVSLSFSIVKYIEILCVRVFLIFSGKFSLIVVGSAVLLTVFTTSVASPLPS